ncbi:MAG: (2Fe-2S)-binding protein [Hyphomicrobiaceae bacterium]|nr:(2Fe-2S)-binding protein [Hyphomicrobiaceae bacterium]
MKAIVRCEVNGEALEALADPRDTLLEMLRGPLGLTGTKEGCSNGNCGSCTVLVDGAPVCACLMLCVEAEGTRITTIEGISDGNDLHPVQAALVAHGGTQCGFCTPGIVMSAVALLAREPRPDATQIRHAIAGNLCRCTGYDKIVAAIAAATAPEAGGAP